MQKITQELLNGFRERTAKEPAVRTLYAAMARTEMTDLAFVPESAAKLAGDFSTELKTRGITAQQKSGRCWLFAVMNVLRERIAEKCGLEHFELSGNYLAFYDRLEKANNFLEMVIENASLPLNDRKMEYILEGGVSDGGYWDMAVDLVRKYGVVPAAAMPETWQSEHTAKFTRLINTLLRKDAAELRRRIGQGQPVRDRKEEMLEEIYRAQCIAFGMPPREFDFEYRDRDGGYHSDRGLTPRTFYDRYAGLDLDQYITVTNHPTPGLPMNYYYRFHYIGNMAEGEIRNLNLTMDELQELCVRQLKGNEAVWFGCDSDAFGDRKSGIWDPDSLNFGGLLGGADLLTDKGERLQYRDSYATHAMILVGVNEDPEGNVDRWKIENSWGEEAGRKGIFVCSPKYFREYVYEAVINRKYLTDAQRALLEGEPVEINAWESDTL